MALTLTLNGVQQTFEAMPEQATLADLVVRLELKPDRIALEQNGNIVARSRWGTVRLAPGDRVEMVHFVGGGRS